MRTSLLISSSLLWAVGLACGEDQLQYKSSLDYIQKTGRLWGVCEVRLNTNGTVTLVDAKGSGYGHGLTMFSPEQKSMGEVTLRASESCLLADGHHASLWYEVKSVEGGVIRVGVTDRFDARSFSGKITEQKASVSIKPYRDSRKEDRGAPGDGRLPAGAETNRASAGGSAVH